MLSLGPFNALAFRFGYFHLVFPVLYLDPANPGYLDEKEELWENKQFLHVIMIQSYFEYLFANSDQYSDYKISPFFHKMSKIYIFRGCGFHTPVEWKIGYYVINKQVIIQILIVKTAFYIYDNMRLKEISILNVFEQIKENTISGSAFSARLGSSAVAFIPDQKCI